LLAVRMLAACLEKKMSMEVQMVGSMPTTRDGT
jgi:hypothetical protein